MGAVRMADEGTDETPRLAPVVPLSFTTFYRRERPQLIALTAAIAGHEHAEEIAQEALLRAHREWARIARYDKPGAWVRRIAINLATSSHRRRRAERRAMEMIGGRRRLDAPPPEVDGFWALVRQLPPRQAAAVALHYLEDLTIAEIAVALDCAEGTAKAHLHKARQNLAERLRTEEHNP
jgi:RNA polymerase sigma-70 factor, ECF subfamily